MRTAVIYLLIMLLFYINLIDSLLPRMMGTINIRWPFFYVVFMAFLIFTAIQSKKIILGKWLTLIVLFCSIIFLSISWSLFYSYELDTILRFIARYIAPALIVIITSNIISTEQHIDIYMRHFAITAAILSVIAIVQSIFFPSSIAITEEGFRASATFGNPNILAIFLVLSVPCVLYCIDRTRIPRLIGYIILCFITVAMVSTASRKGIVTMLLCMFLYYILKNQWKKIVVLSAFVIILVTMIFTIGSFSHRFGERILQREFKSKSNLAMTGISMFTTSPIIGLGYQGFYENYGRYTNNMETRKYDAHNMYVTVLADQGLVGITPFLFIFIYPLIRSVHTWKRKEGLAHDIAVICISTTVPFMINGFYAGAMFITQSIMFVFYSQISLCLTVYNLTETNRVNDIRSNIFSSTPRDMHT